MKKRVSSLGSAALLAMLSLRCGDGGDAPDAAVSDAGSPDAEVVDSGEVGAQVPIPPTTLAFEWPDVEPNDTPEQAVPVGVFEQALWLGFSTPLNAINRDDDVDYYVFRAPDAEGMNRVLQEAFLVCWQDERDLLDLALYAVEDGRVGALVKEVATLDRRCESLMSDTEFRQLVTPEAIYLLQIRAAPGLALGGGVGLYEA